MPDLGQDPTDPNNSLALTRTLAINSDGSYPDQRTSVPSLLRSTVAGNIPAGAQSITVQNVGVAAGMLAGASLDAGHSVTWTTGSPMGFSAVLFDATNTAFLISIVTRAPVPPDPAFTQDPRGVEGFEGV